MHTLSAQTYVHTHVHVYSLTHNTVYCVQCSYLDPKGKSVHPSTSEVSEEATAEAYTDVVGIKCVPVPASLQHTVLCARCMCMEEEQGNAM